jgi:hypothetical protein
MKRNLLVAPSLSGRSTEQGIPHRLKASLQCTPRTGELNIYKALEFN